MSSIGFWTQVRVILRNENRCLGQELIALTGFSLTRAMDSVEGALDPATRCRITTDVIAPLQAAREVIRAAADRRGSAERIVLPGDVADLCRCQYYALCAALADPAFPRDQLPVEIESPVAASARFYRAAGLTLPPFLADATGRQTGQQTG